MENSGLISETGGKVGIFISKKGARETADLLERGITMITLPDESLLPVKIVNGKITRGKLVGDFELHTLTTNQVILGNFDTRGNLSSVQVENSLIEPDATQALIAKEILKLSINLNGGTDDRVLAATTDDSSPVGVSVPLNTGMVASFFQVKQDVGDGSITVLAQPGPGTVAAQTAGITVSGPAGPAGPKGDKGDKGDQGIAGALGPKGADGTAGTVTLNSTGGLVDSSGISLLRSCANGEVLAWNGGTSSWACSASGGGGSAFSSLTTGTNTTATMTVGTGGSLTFSGSGTINASSLGGATFANPGAIGGGTAGAGTFTTLTSTGLTNLGTTGASNVNVATAGTGNTAIGNGTGSFALTSNGGLNVTTGGALTGVASIDTIGTSATALTFAGAGTISSTTTSAITLDSGSTGDVNLGTGASAKTVTLGNISGATAVNINTGTGGINFGDNANTKTIDIGGVTNSGTDTVNIATNGTAADVITIGNTNASTTLALTGGDDWSISSAGLGTFANIIDSGLTASSAVYTNGSKQLTSAAPTSGTIGYLSRSGTTLSPATSGDAFTTSGTISTTGSSSITSAGAFVGPTSTNTINGLIVNSGALSGISTINASGQFTSTLATGTAPFSVASTTNVANLNASSLNGATFASPGAIGSTTASDGTFTTLTANTSITRGSDTITDFTGNGLTVSSNALTINLPSATDALSSTTSSGSGLEVLSSGLTMLQGCSNGQVLKWNESTDVWECSADSTGGSPSFDTIATGTNTTATMTVGTGGTLTFSGSGTVNASSLGGATFAAPGSIGSGTPGAGAFTTLSASSTLTASNGLTMTAGALSLTSTSGSINSTGLTGLTQTLSSGTAAITAPTLNLNTSSTGNTAIGNGTGTFALTSSGGLNVTTGGALTGVASIDTIGTSATALTFAGTGTISSTTTSALTLDSGTTGTVNLGTGNNAKTINIGTGTAGNTLNIGTNNTTADVINIGSALDGLTLSSANWSVTSAGLGTFANIIDNGLSASSAVYTNGSSQLTSTAPTSGILGFWSRSGTTLSTATSGDAVTTSGNISTTSTGTITSAGTLTASNGLTQTTGALNLTSTSGALSLSGMSGSSLNFGANGLTFTASNFNTTATGINSTNIGVTTAGTGVFTTLSSTGTSNIGSGTGVVTLNSSGALNLTQAASSTWTLNGAVDALNFDSNTLSIDASNNRIGIGTNAPSWGLSVTGDQSADRIASISNFNTTSSSSLGVLKLGIGTPTGAGNNQSRFIQFYAGVTTEGGAGTGVGNIRQNNNGVTYASNNADLAELMSVPDTESVSAGDIIAANSGGNVKATSSNTFLIGVVSDTAAFLGNANGLTAGAANVQTVGIAGFVNTKVTGVVDIGDPITIGSTAGVGVRATTAGFIIGKAAASHTGGTTDRILVNVMPGWYDPNTLATATDVNFGDTAVTKTLDIGGVTADGTDTVNISTNSTSADTITIGNSNASTTVAITGGDDWSVTGAGALTIASLTRGGDTITDFTGNGLEMSSNSLQLATTTGGAGLTYTTGVLAVGSGNGITVNANDVTIDLTAATDSLSTTTSSSSGLEALSSGLTMLQGCSNGQVLKWNETTDVWECSADSTGGTPSFDSIATGTNTTATMTVGTGGSLTFSGSGIINASSLGGATFASPGSIGSGTPGTGAFTTLSASSTLTASNGLTMTAGALSLTSTSGSINSTGLTSLTQTLSSGTAAITAPTLNLNTSSTGNTAIGNGTGTFALTSSGGLNVTTGGALTGVASIDGITTSGTALTFAGAGTLSSTGANALTLDSGTSGAVNIGNGASAKSITIGNNTGATTLNLTAGTGSILISGQATGTSATYLGLPVKTDSGDPTTTQINGAMYYNSNSNKFRCYENSAWKDCDTSSGAPAFSAITSGTNTGAAMVVGTGASLTFSGSGIINASSLGGATFAAPGAIGGGTAAAGTFTTLTSTGLTNLGTTGASNVNIATTGTGNTTIGNSTGTFALTSSGGLNVTTGGALTGVASIDTIGTSATALTFVASGSLTSTGANALSVDGGSSGALNLNGSSTGNILIGGGSGSTGCTITNSTGALACTAGITGSNLSGTNTGDITLSAIGATPNANGATLTGQVLNLEPASAAFGGVVTTGTQTLAGAKTFSSLLTGTAGLTISGGTASINTAGTSNTAIGNATGTFALTSNGGLNVTTGGALTGVASIDTIGVTATALSFTGAGTITSNTTNALTLDSGTTGAVNIGTGANAKTVTLGTTSTTSTTNIQSGTGGILLTAGVSGSSSQVRIGNSASATPDLLVLDNGTADPTGVNGGTYYNTSLGKFRCYEAGAWKNCDTAGSGGPAKSSAIVDSTSDTLTGTELELLDGTAPAITPSSTSNRILINGSIRVTMTSNVSQTDTFRVRRGSGSCAGTQIDGDLVVVTNGSHSADAPQDKYIGFSLIDSPGTTSSQAYTVCGLFSGGTANTTPYISMTIIEVAASGADLAEIYASRDDTLSPGDVVSLDSSLEAGVKKSSVAYDKQVLGIVSTNPAMTIGGIEENDSKAVPVALSGRVPVKVSTENGSIVAGDYLTTSSTPGVAMKATKVGSIIGTAMSGFDGDHIGQVLVFVKNGNSNGSSLAEVMKGLDSTSASYNSDVLAYLIMEKDQISLESSDISEIMTDRIVVGLEIITPKVITQDILATGLFVMQDKDGNENVRITSDGNAIFMGTIKADKIIANEIQGFKIFADTLTSLSDKVAGLATASAEISTEAGIASVRDIETRNDELSVADLINNLFRRVAEFFGKVIFHNDVAFMGRPTFNKDTAGFAVIKWDSNEVEVKFEKEYASEPVVTVSLQIVGAIDMNNLPTYAVADVNTKGFKIRMSRIAGTDLRFSWVAIAVSDVKSIESVGNKVILTTTVTPTPISSTTPTIEITLTPSQEASGSSIPPSVPTPTSAMTPAMEITPARTQESTGSAQL